MPILQDVKKRFLLWVRYLVSSFFSSLSASMSTSRQGRGLIRFVFKNFLDSFKVPKHLFSSVW